MTRMLADILRQPAELRACLARLRTSGPLRDATRLLAEASDLYVVGIGASYHACLAAASHLGPGARAAEASELLHQESFRPGSALLVLSRSGKSVEVLGVLSHARRHGVRVVAVTNDPRSPLGAGADVVIPLGVAKDHAVSIVTYTAVGLAAAAATGRPLPDLERSFDTLEAAIPDWRVQLEEWTPPEGAAYFLGRGAGFGTAQEARLLWEEAVKSPATALSTGGFRHGPQEIVRPGLLVGLVIDAERRRKEDLLLAHDLRGLGAELLLVGQGLGEGRGVFRLPDVDPAWQFLLDVVPFQLAGERAARVRGVDCDAFRLCSYVVEFEGGLLGAGL
jgi:glucosamine--fructose-6-phosphate aminotransferase (isomerizing)